MATFLQISLPYVSCRRGGLWPGTILGQYPPDTEFYHVELLGEPSPMHDEIVLDRWREPCTTHLFAKIVLGASPPYLPSSEGACLS